METHIFTNTFASDLCTYFETSIKNIKKHIKQQA
jgi:hypothetical protein